VSAEIPLPNHVGGNVKKKNSGGIGTLTALPPITFLSETVDALKQNRYDCGTIPTRN